MKINIPEILIDTNVKIENEVQKYKIINFLKDKNIKVERGNACNEYPEYLFFYEYTNPTFFTKAGECETIYNFADGMDALSIYFYNNEIKQASENAKQASATNPEHYKNEQGTDLFYLFRKGLLSREKYIGALQFNVIKYTTRFEEKNGQEDLEKAMVYLKELNNFAYGGENEGD